MFAPARVTREAGGGMKLSKAKLHRPDAGERARAGEVDAPRRVGNRPSGNLCEAEAGGGVVVRLCGMPGFG